MVPPGTRANFKHLGIGVHHPARRYAHVVLDVKKKIEIVSH
jgi:hypothetical protein